MIIVTGSVTARPDAFETLLDASLAHVARSRLERGCISHSVQTDCENPLRLFFFERWTDTAKLKVRFRQPGTTEFMAAVRAGAAATEAVEVYQADLADMA
jgi:quinol monooxygenase YgiN